MFPAGRKFELRAPSPQTAVDIFSGHWATDLSSLLPVTGTGSIDLSRDPRPRFVLERFAGPDGTLKGQRVLELGPLEADHTLKLERLGADVTAVEANAEAYLKCLVVKELLGLEHTRFLYGDFVEHLKASDEQYDLIFASGVLYHSDDPAGLIKLMSERSARVFIWTHVFSPGAWRGTRPLAVVRDGLPLTYHQRTYRNRQRGSFWGGNRERACLLTQADLTATLAHYGFANVHIHRENAGHPRGPALSPSAWR